MQVQSRSQRGEEVRKEGCLPGFARREGREERGYYGYMGRGEAEEGGHEQARQSENDHGEGLQVLYRGRGESEIWLVLDMSKRR